MTTDREGDGQDPREAAAAWVVRLHREAASEADWLEFDAWLWAAPEHELAYDEALALWREVEANAGPLRHAAAELEASSVKRSARRAPSVWRPAIAASLAAATLAGAYWAMQRSSAAETVYATAPGQSRTVVLADGSRVDIGGASKLSVRFAGGERHVTMDDAEAVFDVAKDPKRPFIIAVGDRAIRVVGTQFDVRRREGHVAVSVARGVVEVGPRKAPQEGVKLIPGQRLDHIEGEISSQVSVVSADDALAWRKGVLVYHDRPLGEVVADLNAQYRRPVRIRDEALAQRRFSGVLVLGNEDVIVRRLAELASISSVSSKDGVELHL